MGTYWIIEGKSDKGQDDETVAAKRKAAVSLVNKLISEPNFEGISWGYLIAYETDVKTPDSWSDLKDIAAPTVTQKYVDRGLQLGAPDKVAILRHSVKGRLRRSWHQSPNFWNGVAEAPLSSCRSRPPGSGRPGTDTAARAGPRWVRDIVKTAVRLAANLRWHLIAHQTRSGQTRYSPRRVMLGE